MADIMTFPNTVEEFMEQYKITDTEQIYTNGAELVPIFRMKQWFKYKPERKTGKWYKPTGMMPPEHFGRHRCSECEEFAMQDWKHHKEQLTDFCPNCGARMIKEGEEHEICS